MAHYHANPFLAAPLDFPSDPLLPYMAWLKEPSTYGPLWVLLGGGAALLYRDNMLLGVVAFKAMAVLFYLLATVVVYVIVKRQDPGAAAAGALFFAWNPLVTFETAANGHNDVAMALLALLAPYLLARGRAGLSFPLLVASAAVKFITLVLLPAFLLAWLRGPGRRWSRVQAAAWGLALSALLVVALYVPFWQGADTIRPSTAPPGSPALR